MLDLWLVYQNLVVSVIILIILALNVFKNTKIVISLCLLGLHFSGTFLFGYSWRYYGIWGMIAGSLVLLLTLHTVYRSRKVYYDTSGQFNTKPFMEYFLIAISVVIIFRDLGYVFLGTEYRPSNKIMQLEYPLIQKGNYFLVEGGYNPILNSEIDIPAKEFQVFLSQGKRSFGVISPCSGKIREIAKSSLNRKNRFHQKYSNYVVIKCDSQEGVIVLSNIDFDDSLLSKGQDIEVGTFLAKSDSKEYRKRHGLIIHSIYQDVVDPEVLFQSGEAIPMKFANRYLVKNNIITLN